MAQTTGNGPVVLNGESLPEALAHYKANRVERDALVEWLVGRADIGAGELLPYCGDGKAFSADDLSWLMAARAERAALAAQQAAESGKTPIPSLSWWQFRDGAENLVLHVGDGEGAQKITMKPTAFSSGGYGYFGQARFTVQIGDAELVLVGSLSLPVARSKERADSKRVVAEVTKAREAKAAAKAGKAEAPAA